jgi:hypothetical protein
VTESDFLFVVELSDDQSFDRLVSEIASAVFAHVKLSRSDREALLADLRDARARETGTGLRRCDVRFNVGSGQFDLVVAYENGREWRRSRQLT